MRYLKLNSQLIIYFKQQINKELFQPVIAHNIYISTISEYVNKKQIKLMKKALKKVDFRNYPFSLIEMIVYGCISTIKRHRNN